MSDQTPVSNAPTAPKATRSSPWHVTFEKEILATVIAPKIKELLAGGVTSRNNLADVFNEKYGCKVGPDKMTEWLKILGLDAIFGKPTFRLSDPSSVASLAAQIRPAGAGASFTSQPPTPADLVPANTNPMTIPVTAADVEAAMREFDVPPAQLVSPDPTPGTPRPSNFVIPPLTA